MSRRKPPAIAPEQWDEMTEDERRAVQDPDNAANPQAVKAKAVKAKEESQLIGEVVEALLNTPAGRLFYGYLTFEVCGLFRETENAGFDSNALHFREGARAVGLILHRMALRSCAEQYMVLLKDLADKD